MQRPWTLRLRRKPGNCRRARWAAASRRTRDRGPGTTSLRKRRTAADCRRGCSHKRRWLRSPDRFGRRSDQERSSCPRSRHRRRAGRCWSRWPPRCCHCIDAPRSPALRSRTHRTCRRCHPNTCTSFRRSEVPAGTWAPRRVPAPPAICRWSIGRRSDSTRRSCTRGPRPRRASPERAPPAGSCRAHPRCRPWRRCRQRHRPSHQRPRGSGSAAAPDGATPGARAGGAGGSAGAVQAVVGDAATTDGKQGTQGQQGGRAECHGAPALHRSCHPESSAVSPEACHLARHTPDARVARLSTLTWCASVWPRLEDHGS